jgi:hypothetical protein
MCPCPLDFAESLLAAEDGGYVQASVTIASDGSVQLTRGRWQAAIPAAS